MAFTGYDIFPGFKAIDVVNPAVQELAVTFNTGLINALQGVVPEDLKWADLANVTQAIFKAKPVLDLTSLNGFEPFTGDRKFKQVNQIALEVETHPFDRNLEWPIEYDALGNLQLQQIYNAANWTAALVGAAREMKARLAATVFMQGTPSTNKAKVYPGNTIPGAGLSLFNVAHLVNPLDVASATFSNYHAAAGSFSTTTYKTTRQDMRAIPAVTTNAGTLGLQVTHIIGGTRMEEPFREVALQNLYLQTATVGPSGVAAATTNIYSQATTKCEFWVAPFLDADPYYTANPGKHMWIAVSTSRPGIYPIEMAAPSREFMPRVQLFGDGSEMAATSRMIRMIADLSAGAAAGFPHCVARYEET